MKDPKGQHGSDIVNPKRNMVVTWYRQRRRQHDEQPRAKPKHDSWLRLLNVPNNTETPDRESATAAAAADDDTDAVAAAATAAVVVACCCSYPHGSQQHFEQNRDS